MANKKIDAPVSYYYGTGRRKASIARVYIAAGTGKIIVNGREAEEYFRDKDYLIDIKQPFLVTNNVDKFDVKAFIVGGGLDGQTGALRLGISRALLKITADYRPQLKTAGLVSVDARRKERKKYGLKAARRAPQFSKR